MAPPNLAPSDQTEPLLPPKLVNNYKEEPLSPLTSGLIKSLSLLRAVLGAATVIAPQWICKLFLIPVPATLTILPRLFGIREVIIAELLISAEDKENPNRGRREIKRALWANIAADSLDICSVLFGLATGTFGPAPAAMLGCGAATAVALGIAAQKTL
ncbi:hypothetical protein B0J11DRAFT_517706 [Dendryphion nanum]|uniref:Uncharacterized protein n=1 Tax=Dendryphion nanum TaxID=256645 RepID=A0A9P9IWS7_9PLEO|nr:hypothetical protein B0J11DRAFT_517706 [Dendryphion nanum]